MVLVTVSVVPDAITPNANNSPGIANLISLLMRE